MISMDRNIFDKNSAVAQRQIEYAKKYEGKDPISELSEFIDEVKAQKDNISEDNYLQLINASNNIKFNLQKL